LETISLIAANVNTKSFVKYVPNLINYMIKIQTS